MSAPFRIVSLIPAEQILRNTTPSVDGVRRRRSNRAAFEPRGTLFVGCTGRRTKPDLFTGIRRAAIAGRAAVRMRLARLARPIYIRIGVKSRIIVDEVHPVEWVALIRISEIE